jgi:hypothetical protein
LATAYTVTVRQRRLCRDRTRRGDPQGLGDVREVQASHGGDLQAADFGSTVAAIAGVV